MSPVDSFEQVKKLEPLLREYSTEAEEIRHLPQPVVDAMVKAGLFRLFKPEAYGGYEKDPISGFKVLEALSKIDSAAGWNLQLASAIDILLQWFSDETLDELYSGNEEVIVAGTWNPPCTAVSVNGGYRVTGMGNIASGCMNANWFFRNAIVMDGDRTRTHPDGSPCVIFILFPASEGIVLDTWDTMGMCGTGSHDISVENLFVPDHMTALMVPIDAPVSRAYQGPLYRNSVWYPLAALAPPALGIARAALDDFVAMASLKTPSYTEKTLSDKGVVHRQLAEAEATLSAGRAYFYEAVRETWDAAKDPEYRTGTDGKIKLQLATTYAIRSAAAAVDLIHEAVGLSAIRKGQRFQRYFRDVHCITQHAFSSASRYEDVGKLLLGLPAEWPFFEF